MTFTGNLKTGFKASLVLLVSSFLIWTLFGVTILSQIRGEGFDAAGSSLLMYFPIVLIVGWALNGWFLIKFKDWIYK